MTSMPSMTSMTMDMDMGMATNFEFSCDVGPLLFSWWKINNCTSLYLSCIPVILLGCARHWAFNCVAGSKRLVKECSQARTTALLDGPSYQQANDAGGVSRRTRLIWTLISTTGSALSLLSMLVAMSYNGVLFIAILIGEAVGFWIWGNHALPDTMRACH